MGESAQHIDEPLSLMSDGRPLHPTGRLFATAAEPEPPWGWCAEHVDIRVLIREVVRSVKNEVTIAIITF